MFHLISYTTDDTIQKEIAGYALKEQPELRIQRFCEVNNGNKIQNGEVQYYGTKGDKKIVVKECNYKGEEIRTTTITFEFDAQGRMVKEIRAIEGEPLDDGVRRVETINSFYTNGKISKTDVKNITDCEFDEYGTTFEYNEKGYLTKCSRLYGEGGDITEYTAKANNLGGVDSVKILSSGDYIEQSGYRYDANGNLRAVLFGEGKNLSETKRWGAYDNVNNENCTVNIYYEGIMTDIIKTVTENGIVTEFYLEGDQWKHFVTCKVEKQVNGEWVTDPSRRGISVLNIAQLLNQ